MARGSPQQAIPITMLASAARTTSSDSGSLKNTAAALTACDSASLFLSVTALAGQTLDVYIDSSPDNGTTWVTSLHFPQVTTSTAVKTINFRPTGIGVNEVANSADVSTTTTGTVAANTVITPDHRVRWVGGTAFTSGTFAVYALCQPFGTSGQ